MEDIKIIDLFWKREEKAIRETQRRYEPYCRSIAQRMLKNHQDVQECLNDTWLGAWNAIPPHRPSCLRTFLGKITRNLALKRLEKSAAQKRGSGEALLVLEELEQCLAAPEKVEQQVEDQIQAQRLAVVLEEFLRSLPGQARILFLRRYWYFCSIQEIAKQEGISEGAVKSSLFRTREKLRAKLQEEGVL